MGTFSTTREELQASLDLVKSYLAQERITTRRDTDFEEVMRISEAWLSTSPDSPVRLPWSVSRLGWALCVLSRLSFVIQQLQAQKIPFASHMKGMAHKGSAKFGRKDPDNQNQFKDLELEVYVAALLVGAGEKVILHKPGYPIDISFGNELKLDCNHPTKASKIAAKITEFGKKLGANPGILVISLEDVFDLWSRQNQPSRPDFGKAVTQEYARMTSTYSSGWQKNLDANPAIAAIYFFVSGLLRYIDTDSKAKFTIQSMWLPLKRPNLLPSIQKLLDSLDTALALIEDRG